MKQKLLFTLIAVTLAGSALAGQDHAPSPRADSTQQPLNDPQMDAMMRAHLIQVAEAAGFEVLGTSNPDSAAINEMVLTVRPAAVRDMGQGHGYAPRSRGEHDDD